MNALKGCLMSLAALIIIVLLVCLVTGYGGNRAGIDPMYLLAIVLLILLLSGSGIYFGHIGW